MGKIFRSLRTSSSTFLVGTIAAKVLAVKALTFHTGLLAHLIRSITVKYTIFLILLLLLIFSIVIEGKYNGK